LRYDTWLEDSAAYERFAGLDGPSSSESDHAEREIERRIDAASESDHGRAGAD